MIPQLEKHFSAMETQRTSLFQQISKLSATQLYYKPSPDSWSIIETMHHVYLSELGTYRFIAKKIPHATSLPRATCSNFLKTWLLKIMLRSPIKFKVPSRAPVWPSADIKIDELMIQWNELHKQFADLLNTIDLPSAEKQWFKHPVIGYMNIYQTLDFLKEHFQHHLRQLERIKNSPQFPGN